MASVDTNVILRWLLDDVPEQTARAEALLTSGPRFTVDDATMIEVVYVLEKVLRLGRGTIAATIRTLLAEGGLEPDRDHWADVIGVYEGNPKLSVKDVHLALRARAAGPEVFTFDAKLAIQLEAVTLV